MSTWELETLKEIWNNDTGECVEIGPDRDGLGLLELRYRLYRSGQITERFSMRPPIAKEFHRALGRWVNGELRIAPETGGADAPSVIVDEHSGDGFEIGLDRAGVGLPELSARDADGRIFGRIVVPMAAAALVHRGLGELLDTVPDSR